MTLDVWFKVLNASANSLAVQFAIGDNVGDSKTSLAPMDANVHSAFGITGETNSKFAQFKSGSTKLADAELTQSTWLSITWIINNTGSDLTYDNPTGSGKSTVANDCFDIWLKTAANDDNTYTRVVSGKAATTGTVDLQEMYIGSVHGKQLEFRMDNIVVTDLTSGLETYTVTFDAGSNGTCGTSSLTESSGGTGVTLPTVTPNSGYAFNGWYTASSGGTKEGDAGDKYYPDDDVTLYAQYSVTEPPSITSQPTNQRVLQNATATLTVTATGAPSPNYQWYSCDDAEKTNAEAIDGATSASYSPSTTSTGTTYYYVVVSNGISPDATSDVVSLTVDAGATVLFSADAKESALNAAVGENAITSTYATVTGGTMYTCNNQSAAKTMTYLNKMDGFTFSNTNTYFKIELNQALQAGDIINVKTGVSGQSTYGIRIYSKEDKSNYPSGDGSEYTNIVPNGTGYLDASPYTVKATDTHLVGKTTLYIYRNTGSRLYFDNLVISRPPTKTVSTESFYSVKKGETTLTLDTDYTMAGNVITLANSYKAAVAPTDVVLVKQNTYTNPSYYPTEYNDVDVEMAINGEGDFYVGTATINAKIYTVKVPYDDTPTIELSATEGEIELTTSYETCTQTKVVTLTGGNLTDGIYSVTADEAGTTISPSSFTVEDGEVSQEFTITTSTSTAATTVFTFGNSDMGTTAPTYTLTFTTVAKRDLSRTNISTATTWDFKYATSTTGSNAGDILLTKVGADNYTVNTNPARDEEFLLADLPEITNDATFNSQALLVTGQYMRRWIDPEWAFQGSKIKFTVTTPGKVKVTFSNTGNNAARYLYINGVNTGAYSATGHPTYEGELYVPIGDVTIEFYTSAATPVATLGRIAKIEFTPIAEPSAPVVDGETITLTTTANMDGWRPYYNASNNYSVDEDTKVYVADEDPVDDVISLKAIDGVPAGVPVILHTKAASREMTLTQAAADTYTYDGTNLLEVTTDAAVANVYRLGYNSTDGVGFYPYSGKPGAGIVYLDYTSGASARALTIRFDDEETTSIKDVVRGSSNMESIFDLQGRRVAQPSKGLYIVNGRKVVIK